MKKEFIGLIFTIFLMTFVLGDIRYDQDDPYSSFVHTNLDNRNNDNDLDGMKVSVFFPELPLMVHTNSLDLDDGDVKATRTLWDDYDIPSGEHFVRICAHNDHVNECAYRYIDFV